jgi:hypothetical protein
MIYDKVHKIYFNEASLQFSFQHIAYIKHIQYIKRQYIIHSKTHTKSIKPWYRDWIITDSYVVLFSKKDFLRKNICCNKVLPISSTNRPIFVSRLKLTSPIQNYILSKGDNSKKARPRNRSVIKLKCIRIRQNLAKG